MGLLSHHRSLVNAAVADPSVAADSVELIHSLEALDFTPHGLQQIDNSSEPGLVAELRGLRSVLWAGTSNDPLETESRIAELERMVLGFDRAQSNRGHVTEVPDVVTIANRRDVAVVYVTQLASGPSAHVLHSGAARSYELPGGIRKNAADAAYLAGLVATGLIPSAGLSLNRLCENLARTWDEVLAGVDTEVPLVIVAGPLGALPWGLIETFRARRYSIVPSLTWWASEQDGMKPTRNLTRALFVEGPDLRDVDAELDALQNLYHDVVVLRGSNATSAAVLEHFGRVDVAHVAAHGEFRSDNALLSSLRLADGPLFVRDLARIQTPPALAVFASCSTGQGKAYEAGTLGLSSLLLWAGASATVAPHALIEADEISPLMARFHERISSGDSTLAGALAELRVSSAVESTQRRSHAASTFSLFGNDFCIKQ